MRWTIASLMAPLGAVMLLAGCRAGPKADPSLFGDARDADRALRAEDSHVALVGASERPVELRFEIIGGKNVGGVRLLEIRTRGEGTILLRSSIEGADHADSVQRFTIADDGAILSPSITNRARGVITEFDPPLVVFPAVLEPGEPFTQTLEFIVHPIDDPEKVNQRGDATSTMELAVRQPVSLPDGRVECLLVRIRLDVDFGAAGVERTTDQWFLPGAGLVAESFDEEIKVLGITTEHTREAIRAVSTPSE